MWHIHTSSTVPKQQKQSNLVRLRFKQARSPPPHSGELYHALSPSQWGPTPFPAIPPYVVRTPTSPMEHRLQKKTSTIKTLILMLAMKTYLKEKLKKEETFFEKKKRKEKRNEKNAQRKIDIFTVRTSQRFLLLFFCPPKKNVQKTCGDQCFLFDVKGTVTTSHDICRFADCQQRLLRHLCRVNSVLTLYTGAPDHGGIICSKNSDSNEENERYLKEKNIF